MSDLITLPLAKNKWLEVKRLYDEQEIYAFEEIKITFFVDNKEYIVYENDFIGHGILMFKGILAWTIDGKFELDKSIVGKKIGLLSNDYTYNMGDETKDKKAGLLMKKSDTGTLRWIGEEYMLWSSNRGYTTWMYNEAGKIIMEITPDYKWHFADPEEDEDFISYEEFRINYKTYFKTVIPREVALDWLERCKEIERRMYY